MSDFGPVIRAYVRNRHKSVSFQRPNLDEEYYAKSLPEGLVDAVSGFGDGVYNVITLGFGDLEEIRKLLGSGGTVNMDSPNYFWANITGQGYALFLPLAPKGYNLGSSNVQVAHWEAVGRSAELQANQWVMIGSNKNVLNYLLSGVGLGNVRISAKFPYLTKGKSYPFRNSSITEVSYSQLQWPKGWEKWKGLIGQRRYKP